MSLVSSSMHDEYDGAEHEEILLELQAACNEDPLLKHRCCARGDPRFVSNGCRSYYFPEKDYKVICARLLILSKSDDYMFRLVTVGTDPRFNWIYVYFEYGRLS